MSTYANSVRIVSYKELQIIKDSNKFFLLFFKGVETNPRTKGVLWACNYYCSKYIKVKCYCMDSKEYRNKNYSIFSNIYNVLKFKGKQEICNVPCGLSKELETLFSDTQKEIEDQHSALKTSQGSQSHQPERSDKSGTKESHSLGKFFFTDQQLTQQKIRFQHPIIQAATYEFSGFNAPQSPSLPYQEDSLYLRDYEITYKDKLKMRISVCKPTQTTIYPTKVSTPSNNYSMPCGDPLSSKSIKISQSFLIESELSENPILLPISPQRSVESAEFKQKPHGETDILTKSETQSKNSKVKNRFDSSGRHSTSPYNVILQPNSHLHRGSVKVSTRVSSSHSADQLRRILPRYSQRPQTYPQRPVVQQYQPRPTFSSRLSLSSNRVPRPNTNQVEEITDMKIL